MAKTIESDAVDFNDAEDFKQPTDGVHDGYLSGVTEWAPTKKALSGEDPGQEQIVLTIALSEDDPDAPNFPMRFYVGWPIPSDKDKKWGSRTAYGSKVKSLKDVMTAFGGSESGKFTKEEVYSFLSDKVGSAVKVRTKQELYNDQMSANIRSLSPA